MKTEQVDSWQHFGRGKPSQGVLPRPRHSQVQCVSPSYRKGTKFSFSFAIFSLDTCEADCIERGAASCWGRVAPQGLVGGAHTSVLFSASLWREVEYVSFPHYKQCFNQGSFPSSPGAHVVSPKQAQDHKDRSVIGSSHPGPPESGVGVGPIPASCGE